MILLRFEPLLTLRGGPIAKSINVEFVENFSIRTQRIADEVFGPDVSSRLGFGIATPANASKVEPHELTAFTVDLINMPSSYYLLALEGRISIVPCESMENLSQI